MIRGVTFVDDSKEVKREGTGRGGGGGRGGRLKGSLGRGVPPGLSNHDPD